MSSFTKAAKANQRVHKERQQPESRKHLGYLEKKKDYKVRARDFQNKQQKLKRLQQRALSRNPDEFYFHMINSKIKDGEHHERLKGEEFTDTQLKLMQTQDLNYITMKRNAESKKIDKLQASLHFLEADTGVKNKHTFFVDSKKEAKNFDFAKRLETHPAMLDRTYNRPRIETLQEKHLGEVSDDVLKEARREMKKSYHELTKRIGREKELAVVEAKMEMKKRLLDRKQPPIKKVKDGTKVSAPIYLWKKERKR
ncbi:probable U3 small nucleolar RNA-associated protein 11 [Ornithodoros turicata]|uniref:probable U3 small nucleolar RNA-associated protein 11 n=1 Tax=Ornithodoros turicata TaxID=34597 RepID=UPI003139176E